MTTVLVLVIFIIASLATVVLVFIVVEKRNVKRLDRNWSAAMRGMAEAMTTDVGVMFDDKTGRVGTYFKYYDKQQGRVITQIQTDDGGWISEDEWRQG